MEACAAVTSQAVEGSSGSVQGLDSTHEVLLQLQPLALWTEAARAAGLPETDTHTRRVFMSNREMETDSTEHDTRTCEGLGVRASGLPPHAAASCEGSP